MPLAAIALGSNLGDRRGNLDWAVRALTRVLSGVRASRVIETAPEGVPDVQPPYLNAAVVGDCALPASELMARLLGLEQERGRERKGLRSARTLDLDLILFGDEIVEAPGVVVPHPRYRERRFVLEPLAEIAPEMRDPVTGRTIAETLAALRDRA